MVDYTKRLDWHDVFTNSWIYNKVSHTYGNNIENDVEIHPVRISVSNPAYDTRKFENITVETGENKEDILFILHLYLKQEVQLLQ